MPLRETLLGYWRTIQGELFPWPEEELRPLSERHKHLVTALEVARVEVFLGHWHGVPGHPPSDRSALARASAAKGEERPREKRRLERQADMSLADLLADPAFRPLSDWLRLRHVDVAEVQAAVDQVLEQVRPEALT